ncbi:MULTISPECIES: patatin-like phospholipase family protein [unclassified Cupriavidus]|uniref:patatin-like phospholipase family protein n=1 Tax=unclassified Cupriavidus TaxID=2640874 RepID=UPI001BFFF2B2|nr:MULTISPECIES: patatin-like phospholipase family protein [unclassified Cupriavidus]MCA3187859.1 patatin-like phospholipase family protein [Cupriavidus sp.]MCA3191527.1 patatin-like phospholipase family protein [Cupriavidus sp.]MCA3199878.1 patatin-like phospholipase family protein [Cupriavidus sp.]MCA3201712.1 patatin-like phospholipase family protein [Cupriavidus sp.]MCA3206767.1 patatin-like phospholipase family protein [Cupriavidus sp.]
MQRRLFLGASAATLLAACSFGPKPTTPATPTTAAVPPVAAPPRPVRIGLALGGGAARGFAHIGVIKALEAQGIHPDIVTGTSAGSVVAALYATGMDGFQLNKLALTMDEAAIADWALPFGTKFGGWLKGEALQNYVNRLVKNRPIEAMKLPLGIVATDLKTGGRIVFRRGNTGQAVRASSSVPGVFQPVSIAGHDYVDGGLVEPVPVDAAREMGAEFVIAVNISADPSNQKNNGQSGVLLQTTAIMGQSINRMALSRADIVIRPDLPDMGGSDFASRNRAILAGEQATSAVIGALREKLAAARLRPAAAGTVAGQ